ncbi:unnamed protein product, partial [Effrenium voratum]
ELAHLVADYRKPGSPVMGRCVLAEGARPVVCHLSGVAHDGGAAGAGLSLDS